MDRLRRDRALEDVLVEEDDAVRRSDVAAHRVVVGVDDDVVAAFRVVDDLVEVLGLVRVPRPREDDDRVLRRGRDHVDEALAAEEEAGRDEDEAVHGESEPLAERPFRGGVGRHRGVLEGHGDQREVLLLALVVREQVEPVVRAMRVDHELAGQPADEREHRAVAQEPVRDA